MEDTGDMKDRQRQKSLLVVIGKAGKTTDNIPYERTNSLNQGQEVMPYGKRYLPGYSSQMSKPMSKLSSEDKTLVCFSLFYFLLFKY